MKRLLASILAATMFFSLVACGGGADKSGGNNTVVGRWSCTDESCPGEISFAEDGDFYDGRSNGWLMRAGNGIVSNYTRGTWKIRADGLLWFYTKVPGYTDDYGWGYSYRLDGDTLTIGNYTFTRVR